jgi:hypothetical protein
MTMPIVPVQTWALPDNEVDCLPGGFFFDNAGGTVNRSAKTAEPPVEEKPAPKKRKARRTKKD